MSKRQKRQRRPDARTIERVIEPILEFAGHRLFGAGLLLAGMLVALAWANSPWAATYAYFQERHFTVGFDNFQLSKPLILWINDGLMGIFFFVVGLEIKREILVGELSSVRKAALPIAGALGGMIVPAVLYTAVNMGGPGAHGWGIPMATDIAFALGVMALLGDRVPLGLKIFLTALAIVDDIGAIVVIAVFYTDEIATGTLLIGAFFFGLSVLANRLGVRNSIFYALLGVIVWVAFLKSGVHATLAAVLMAFTIPARTRIDDAAFVHRMETLVGAYRRSGLLPGTSLLTPPQQDIITTMSTTLEEGSAPLQRLEHALLPLATVVVLPVFALANAGIVLSTGAGAALLSPVCLGVAVGLVLGKPLGIAAAAWVTVKGGLAELPAGVTWRHIWGAGVLGGIGFTMSLFISGLAFVQPEFQNAAKLGILAASTVAGVTGWVMLRRFLAPAAPTIEGLPPR